MRRLALILCALSLGAAAPDPAERLPDSAQDPTRVLHCDLEHPHEGPHTVLARHANGRAWWVQWSLTASEINEIHLCGAHKDPTKPDHCLLFQDHPGRHLYGTDPE